MRFSVIIPTKNRSRDLRECIIASADQTHMPYEVIIVDDNSSDTTPEMMQAFGEEYPFIKYVRHEKSCGQAIGKNNGAGIAHGDILVFTDDDCIPDKRWLEYLEIAFSQHDRAGAVGGKIINLGPCRPSNINALNLPMLPLLPFLKNKTGRIYKNGWLTYYFDSNKEDFVDWVSGGNMAVRKHVFEEVGGFDANYIGDCSYEEPDICARIRKEGHRIFYCPQAICQHKYTQTFRMNDSDKSRYVRANEMYFIFKNIDRTPLNIFLLSILHLWQFSILTFLSLFSKKYAAGLKGKIAGYLRWRRLHNSS